MRLHWLLLFFLALWLAGVIKFIPICPPAAFRFWFHQQTGAWPWLCE
jgi:hypothetical protein